MELIDKDYYKVSEVLDTYKISLTKFERITKVLEIPLYNRPIKKIKRADINKFARFLDQQDLVKPIRSKIKKLRSEIASYEKQINSIKTRIV